MNNYVEVSGDLFNTSIQIMCVEAVEYDRYDDNYNVKVHSDAGHSYRHTFSKTFKIEQEAKDYRAEFVAKVCIWYVQDY